MVFHTISYVPVGITEYQRQKVYLGIFTKHEKSPLVLRCLSISMSLSESTKLRFCFSCLRAPVPVDGVEYFR